MIVVTVGPGIDTPHLVKTEPAADSLTEGSAWDFSTQDFKHESGNVKVKLARSSYRPS